MFCSKQNKPNQSKTNQNLISPKLDNVLLKASRLCSLHAAAIQVGVVLVGPFHLVMIIIMLLLLLMVAVMVIVNSRGLGLQNSYSYCILLLIRFINSNNPGFQINSLNLFIQGCKKILARVSMLMSSAFGINRGRSLVETKSL